MDKALPFPDQDDVHKRRQGFGVKEGHRAAHDDQCIVVAALGC